jgi:hypothetical protein
MSSPSSFEPGLPASARQSGGGPSSGGPDDQEILWGALAHALSFVAAYVALGFLAPLAVILFFGKRSSFVRAHAYESLNFQLTTLLVLAAGGLFGAVTLGLGLVVLLPLGLIWVVFYLVVVIQAALRARRGAPYRYPLTLRFFRP